MPTAERLARMTPEQRERYRAYEREYTAKRRALRTAYMRKWRAANYLHVVQYNTLRDARLKLERSRQRAEELYA